jgi:chromosome segregation ATPase
MWAKGFPPRKSFYVKVLEDVLVGPAWPEVMRLLEAMVEVPPVPTRTEARAERTEVGTGSRSEPHPQKEGKREEGEPKKKNARKAQDLTLSSPAIDELFARLDFLEKRFKNLEEFLLEDFPSIVRKGLDAEVSRATTSVSEEFAEVKKEVNVWREHVRYANDSLHRFGQRLEEMEKAIKEMGRKLSALEEALQKIKDRIAGFVR